jgi:NAD-dependent DNA ligase
MKIDKDPDGQPIAKSFNHQRVRDSRLDELMGICRGVLADGTLVIEEARYVLDWLERNSAARETFVGRELHAMLLRSLEKGVLMPEHEEALVTLLMKIIGGTPADPSAASMSSSVPLDDPPPAVRFADRAFCFTGKFGYGTRDECQKAVLSLGGSVHDNPKLGTDYLVIGDIGSRDWAHSAMGRKIERAVQLRENGQPIGIVGEAIWAAAMDKRSTL